MGLGLQHIIVIVLAVFAVACVKTSYTAQLLPTKDQESSSQNPDEAYLSNPTFTAVTISPKGDYIATVAWLGGQYRLAFFESVNMLPLGAVTFPSGESVSGYRWINDHEVALELASQYALLDRPVGHGEIFAYNVKGKGRVLFGYRAGQKKQQTGSHVKVARNRQAYGRLLNGLPMDRKRALIMVRSWRAGRVNHDSFSIERLNIHSGTTKKVLVPDDTARFGGVFVESTGVLRVFIGTKVWWKNDDDNWIAIEGLGISKRATGLHYNDRTQSLIIKDRLIDGREGIFSVSMSGAPRIKLIAARPGLTSSVIATDPNSGAVTAVSYEPHYNEWQAVDEQSPWWAYLKSIISAFPDSRVNFVSRTVDGNRQVVFVDSPTNPGAYYLAERNKPLRPILEAYSELPTKSLVPVEPFQVKTADGLLLTGYLTLPRGPEGAHPLVVLPHGGPHQVRDYWKFYPAAQLLASHGYAVLQINFRGSSGYGRAFEQAGYKQWGSKIQEDIITATRWAVQQGVADPKRICIFGGSFGAYAAMRSAAMAPDLFKCAVGYAGVYDLSLLGYADDLRRSKSGRAYAAVAVGSNAEKLRAASPNQNAEELKVPVFIAHGGRDERAPIKHAELLIAALKASGNPPEELIYSSEGHGFFKIEHRIEFYEQMLAFFGKHIGTPAAQR